MDRLLKVQEVADLWGVDKMTVYRAIWAGELAYVNLARPGAQRARIRVRPAAAEAYLAQRDREAVAA
ncbi:MAG TPA: helix-turn-helix domain-containing protein [Micromonosporaceae bacterium]